MVTGKRKLGRHPYQKSIYIQIDGYPAINFSHGNYLWEENESGDQEARREARKAKRDCGGCLGVVRMEKVGTLGITTGAYIEGQ